MDICSSEHDEVCYEGGYADCPVCNMRDDMQGTIDSLEQEIKDLEEAE